jgi:hypothetical protein
MIANHEKHEFLFVFFVPFVVATDLSRLDACFGEMA